MPNIITDNPALVTGFIRALLIAVASFWPGLFSASQQEAILALAAASLALTAVTVKTTVPKTPSMDAPASAIQAPPA